MSFDWKTDDSHWVEGPDAAGERGRGANPQAIELPDAAPAPVEIEHSHPRPRRRIAFLAFVSLFSVMLLAVVYWRLERRAQATERRLAAEISAGYETLTRAAVEGDAELFRDFLSGRDRTWVAAQEALVRTGSFVDRPAFNLVWLPSVVVSPTVTLSADLRSAELNIRRDYSLNVGRGLTETITLQTTSLFRRGRDRWLFAPPEAEFWGATQTVMGPRARVSYPTRDATIGERLAGDLNSALVDLCAPLPGDCAPLAVDLSSDPADLARYSNPLLRLQGGSRVILPTPTLFGVPVDEAGYRALFREYAARVVSAAVANYAGWACCEDALFYSVLLEAELHRLGLRPWVVNAEDFEQVAGESSALAVVEAAWRYNMPATLIGDARPVFVLIDFLVNEAGVMPIPEMQRALLDAANRPYWSWLQRVTAEAYASQVDFEREWLRYARQRSGAP